MGKFIQPGKRPISPIFPQMPNPQPRMSWDAQPPKKREMAAERPKEEAPVKQQKPVMKKAVPPQKPAENKKITTNDLRNGFKMSVIIGEPVSKKYRRFK